MTVQSSAVAQGNCRRCGEISTGVCADCDEALCQECLEALECGTVLCVACGGPVNHDWDMVFDVEGGGLHRGCD